MSVNGTKRKKAGRKAIKRRRVIISWLLTGLFLMLFYIVFCAFIGSKHFYANTSINGIDVSGLTSVEASELVKTDFDTKYKDVSVTVMLKDMEYRIQITDALNMNILDVVERSLNRSHGFFGRGVNYIKSLFVDSSYDAKPFISNKKAIIDAISNSGINDVANSGEKPYEVKNGIIYITKGKGGYEVNIDNLTMQIESIILNDNFDEKINCPLKYSDIDIQSIYDDIYVEPANPTLDPDNDYAVVDARKGVSFDMKEAKKLIDAAGDDDIVKIPIIYTEPDITTAQYKELLYRDILGSFTTSVSGSDNRKNNVRLASENCDGTVIMPGDAFSFNNTVGERTIDRGFMAAPSYVNGESVDEVGGGICQVSSTLYNACLYANLYINERHCHPHESSYVNAGFDATVSWGGPDYVFTNNTNYPIKISSLYDGSNLYCVIYGTKESEFYVELSSETLSVTEYETKYEDDDTLEEGKEEVEVRGINGFTVQTYRKVYDAEGNVIYNEPESISAYSKQDELIKVGTKKKKKPKKDKTEAEATTEEPESTTDATTEVTTESTEESTTEKTSEDTN